MDGFMAGLPSRYDLASCPDRARLKSGVQRAYHAMGRSGGRKLAASTPFGMLSRCSASWPERGEPNLPSEQLVGFAAVIHKRGAHFMNHFVFWLRAVDKILFAAVAAAIG